MANKIVTDIKINKKLITISLILNALNIISIIVLAVI